jgi:hypothetical protein
MQHRNAPLTPLNGPCPGDLLQMDTKRFAYFTRPGHAVDRERVGYELANSMIDDHSRLAYAELHRDERRRRWSASWSGRSRSSAPTGPGLATLATTTRTSRDSS